MVVWAIVLKDSFGLVRLGLRTRGNQGGRSISAELLKLTGPLYVGQITVVQTFLTPMFFLLLLATFVY